MYVFRTPFGIIWGDNWPALALSDLLF